MSYIWPADPVNVAQHFRIARDSAIKQAAEEACLQGGRWRQLMRSRLENKRNPAKDGCFWNTEEWEKRENENKEGWTEVPAAKDKKCPRSLSLSGAIIIIVWDRFIVSCRQTHWNRLGKPQKNLLVELPLSSPSFFAGLLALKSKRKGIKKNKKINNKKIMIQEDNYEYSEAFAF